MAGQSFPWRQPGRLGEEGREAPPRKASGSALSPVVHPESKEQAIWDRIFRIAAEVRAAVAGFVARYNAEWRLERLGYLSPLAYRAR